MTSGARWSDPATWASGRIPNRTTDVLIPVGKAVEVDTTQAEARVLVVEGTLLFGRGTSATLTLAGNLIVRGTGRVEMRPNGPEIVHTLRFVGIDERRYVGGHTMEPLDSDVGLWVQGGAVLDAQGSAKLAWTRLAGGVQSGQTRITLAQDPVGWRAGDELILTPTLPPTTTEFHDAYDYVTIQSISGRDIILDRPLQFAHPAVQVRQGVVMAAEVLNVTRNVRIEGTPTGRAHIILNMATRPQVLKYLAIRYMGPQRPPDADGNVSGVLGRYPLHFHRMGDASRGSLVEGVVVRDVGNLGVNTHGSHGVTVRRTIVHDGYEMAGFGWDPLMVDTRTKDFSNGSHDILWEECVASRITFNLDYRGFRTTGFFLAGGKRNRLVNSVAVGVQGNKDASGVHWGEGESVDPGKSPDGEAWGIWDVRGVVSHNNRRHGWFTWQNTGNVHRVGFGSVLYHNGGFGLSHGAYGNPYDYRDMTIYGNREGGVLLHAVSTPPPQLRFENVYIDQAGLTDFAVQNARHAGGPGAPTLFLRGTLRGYRRAAIGVLTQTGNPDVLDVVDTSFGGVEFWIANDAHVDTQIRWQNGGTALLLRRADAAGDYFEPRWNARVTRIGLFW
ncbi:MAG: G8 domain-containing protein [Armatimonadota bacterium]|nr:G8 domain-containing protein [Armatimonadota bacterium]